MPQFQLHLPFIKLAFAITVALLGSLPVGAQFEKPMRGSNQPRIFNTPPPPPDIGKPQTTTGGGSRGCESEDEQKQPTSSQQQKLIALIPSNGWGLTTSDRPTFWFYVAYSRQLSGEFVLQDEAERTIYQTRLTMTGTPGVVSFSLPSTVAPLEIGKRYRWYFNIYCQPEQVPVFVEGWIKRAEPNPTLNSQLEKATPQQRVSLYAAEGLWYNALSLSAELHRTNANDTNWTALLKDVGLDAIATEPIVECCQPEN
ncbi:MAG TPA: DUF928 domain-containing protein [Waterburya sp.]|jgi:hypothetical protein